MKIHIVRRAAGLIPAFLLVVFFQNCGQAKFGGGEAMASSTAPEITGTQTPPMTPPPPPPAPPVNLGAQSVCGAATMTKACPDGSSGCTCTDTLPAGTYYEDEDQRARFAGDSSVGPNCRAGGTGSYAGTVVSSAFGVCEHYCGVVARCVAGAWVFQRVVW